MKSIISIVVFSLSFVFQIGASNLDSLIEVANGLPDDSSRVNALLEISAGLWQTEPEEAIKYADEAITLCKKINFPKGLALAYKNIGLAHYIKGDYTNVLDYWLQSLEAYRSNGDKPGISNLLGNIGAVYFNRGDDPNALKYFLEALRVSEEIKDTLRTATLLVNIGAVNFNKPAT
ncbi:MAG: tetratricopeptide repeat protein, partial [Bacteroidota bacterium]